MARRISWSNGCRQVPSGKGSTLKGKNLLPKGVNSFLLEKTPLQSQPCLSHRQGLISFCMFAVCQYIEKYPCKLIAKGQNRLCIHTLIWVQCCPYVCTCCHTCVSMGDLWVQLYCEYVHPSIHPKWWLRTVKLKFHFPDCFIPRS